MHDIIQPLTRTAYSKDEFARAVGISLSTVKVLIDQKRLRVVKVGRRTLIPAAEMVRLLAAD
jgi:excisionase family DNA binding protein